MSKTTCKKLAALWVAFVIVFSCSTVVSAACPKKTFKVRWSDGYGFANATITFTATNTSGTRGYATLNNPFKLTTPEGKKICLNAGTTWDYKISSIKDGAKITLVTDYNRDTGRKAKTDDDSYEALCETGMAKMTGKIHIERSKTFTNIWKIDTFTRIDTSTSGPSPEDFSIGISGRFKDNPRPGFYFRDT